jgi:hypothetical protein
MTSSEEDIGQFVLEYAKPVGAVELRVLDEPSAVSVASAIGTWCPIGPAWTRDADLYSGVVNLGRSFQGAGTTEPVEEKG